MVVDLEKLEEGCSTGKDDPLVHYSTHQHQKVISSLDLSGKNILHSHIICLALIFYKEKHFAHVYFRFLHICKYKKLYLTKIKYH